MLAPLDFNVRAELQQVAICAGLSPDTFNNTIIEVGTCPAAACSAAGQHHFGSGVAGHLLHRYVVAATMLATISGSGAAI